MNELEIIQHRQIEGLSLFINTVDYRTSHFHPEWELIWVLDQTLSVTCEQSTFPVRQGQMVLFSPSVPHEFHKADRSCTFLCLQLSPRLLPSMPQMSVDGRHPQEHLSPEELRWVEQTLLDTARDYFQGEEHYELGCFARSSLILHKLLTRLPCRVLTPEEAADRDKRNGRLKRMIRFVDENYMHKIRLSDFAEAEGCSMSYLSHFIKDATNQTFQEYVNSVRFGCACKLIAGGGKKMLDVCMESGFSDYRYFCRAFRQQYGMTPEEYSRHTHSLRRESAAVRHSLHSLEQFYTREESLMFLEKVK